MIAFSFFSVYAVLLAVYALFLARMRKGMHLVEGDKALYASPAQGKVLPFISVVVPLRNEAANVPALAQSLFSQTYPEDNREFLFVDDHSEDETADALERIVAESSGVHASLIRLDASSRGKKAAITAAIGKARGDVILTTDADCTHPPDWIEAMAIPFTHGMDVVAGPVVITKRDSLFARLQAMDFLGLMGVGAGFFGLGFPRLCNGANLAYRKAMFINAGGFEGNEGMSSGDDEYLLHKIVYQQRGEAAFTADARAVVHTPPVSGLWSFLMQRSRWASKGARYTDGGFIAFLVLLFFFYLFSALLPFAALLSPLSFIIAVAAFILKSWIEMPTVVAAARLLRQPIRILDFIIAELLHPFYLVVVTIAGTIGVGTWKGRKLETKN